jgi:hypothetical protein
MQSNFRLLIITHDEDFIERMTQVQLIDSFATGCLVTKSECECFFPMNEGDILLFFAVAIPKSRSTGLTALKRRTSSLQRKFLSSEVSQGQCIYP